MTGVVGRAIRPRNVGLAAVAIVMALGMTACSSGGSGADDGDDDAASPTSSPTATSVGGPGESPADPGASVTTSAPLVPAPPLVFDVGSVEVHSPVEPIPVVTPEMQAALVGKVTEYVEAASLAPLTGRGVRGLDGIFSLDAVARLAAASSQDRLVLVDEGLAPATTSLVIESATIDLSALADQAGSIAVAGAHIDVRIHVGSSQGDYVLARSGDLTLTAFQGAWFIDGWALTVNATPTTAGPATTGVVLPEVTVSTAS